MNTLADSPRIVGDIELPPSREEGPTTVSWDITSRHHGEVRQTWDPNVPGEVELMREHFNVLVAKKYRPAKVNADGTPGDIIHEFDPNAGKLIFLSPIAGG